MPYVDSQGNEIPGTYTEAEVEAKVAEALSSREEEANELNQRLEETRRQLAEVNEKLAKADNKDTNIGQLKKSKESLEAQLKNVDSIVASKVNEALKPIVGDIALETIKKLSKNDTELEKRIQLEFDKY